MQTQNDRHKTILSGPPRLIVQAGWWIIAGVLVATFAAGVPVRLDALLTVVGGEGSAQVAGLAPQLQGVYTLGLGPQEAGALQALGLSQRFYAAYVVGFEVALALICLAMAFLIFWRRSDDWMALWVSLSLVLLGTSSVTPELPTLAAVSAGWALLLVSLVYTGSPALGMVSHVHILLLLPDGRFVPRWTLALAAAFTGGMFALECYAGILAGRWWVLSIFIVLIGVPAWLGLVTLGVISQMYRYRRVSGPVQRQQTKWMVVGLAGFTLGFMLNAISLFVVSQQSGLPRVLTNLARAPLVTLLLLFLPVGLGFAILRYRLWDIDLIIRRTLIYSGLTAALVLVYLGSVVLLQALFQALTGARQSEFVTVVSTLAIAALFIPLRRRLQDLIDRLFYRRKYDAAKTLAAFSATLRDETDLAKLTERSLSVVDETMRPAHVSLWLRENDMGRVDPKGFRNL